MNKQRESSDRGYSITHGVFSGTECDDLLDALSDIGFARGRAGARHLMANSLINATAHDPRLLQIAKDSVGTCAIPYRATLFDKSENANWLVVWHQDTALPLVSINDGSEWGPWSKKAGVIYAHAPTWALSRSIALRLHLDASTNDNGPLRIIPGSHVNGVLSDEEVFAVAKRQTAVNCVGPRGSVLSMRPLLIHSSSKSRSDLPRRVLHIEYAASLDLSDSVRLAIA
jgi:ectoine hydroxylase-related dioxygenase (phytanoyl-CoA dioxygenase family)